MPDFTFTTSLLDRMKEEEAAGLRSTLGQAVQSDPASYAKDRALAQSVGVRTRAVQDEKVRAMLSPLAGRLNKSVDEILGEAPKTSQWLQKDEDNAPVAWTTLDQLIESEARHKKLVEDHRKWVEDENRKRGIRWLSDSPEDPTSYAFGAHASGTPEGFVGGLLLDPGRLEATARRVAGSLAGLAAIPYDVPKAVYTAVLPRPVSEILDTGLKVTNSVWWRASEAQEYWQKSNRVTESLLMTDPKTGEQFFNWGAYNPLSAHGFENLVSAVESEAAPFAAQAYIAMQTGGISLLGQSGRLAKLGPLSKFLRYATSVPAGMEGGRTVQGQFTQNVQQEMAKGLSREQAEEKVAPAAVLAGGLSFLAGAPMEAAFFEHLEELASKTVAGATLWQKIMARMRAGASAATKEGVQEVLNGLGEDASEYFTFNPDKTGKEFFANAVQNFVGGAMLGGPTGALIQGSRAQRMANQEAFVKGLHEGLSKTELAKVAPDKLAEYVSHITEGGPVADLAVGAQAWNSYWQSIGEDPAAKAAEMGVDPQDYKVATESGGDLVMPTGNVAQHIAGTEHFDGLFKSMKPGLGRETFGEIAQNESDARDASELQALIKDLPESKDRDTIRGQIASELRAATKVFTPGEVNLIADGFAKLIVAQAQRAKLEPLQLFERNRLNITSRLATLSTEQEARNAAQPEGSTGSSRVQGPGTAGVGEGVSRSSASGNAGIPSGELAPAPAGFEFAAGVRAPARVWHGAGPNVAGLSDGDLRAEDLEENQAGGIPGLNTSAGPHVADLYNDQGGLWKVGIRSDAMIFDGSMEKVYTPEQAQQLGILDAAKPYTGNQLWEYLVHLTGSTRAASDALRSVGFNGMYYNHGGEDAWAIWDDSAIQRSARTTREQADAEYALQGSRRDDAGFLKVGQALSPEARAMSARVVEALSHVEGPEIGDEVVGPTTLYQISDLPAWEKKITQWMKDQGRTAEEIKEHLGAVRGQMAIFSALGPMDLELLPEGAGKNPGAGKGPIRTNQDPIYKVTFDATAMCVKRLEAAATLAYIEDQLDRPLTLSERTALVATFRQEGKTAPCLYCYVEAPRGKASEMVLNGALAITGVIEPKETWSADALRELKAAQEEWSDKGRATVETSWLLDPKKRDSVEAKTFEAENPAVAKFLKRQYGGAKPNVPKLYEQYSGQILELKDALIEELNGYAGFRFFSSSDFQAEHVVDLMQAINDLSLRGAKAHAYTKVEEFVNIFGNTGMKIQTSIFANVVDGEVVADTWQGMDWGKAQELRAKFPHVGTVLVGTSDEIIRWGLDQDWVDYIIPFHASGMEKRFFDEMKWKNYSATQTEKSLVKGAEAKKIRMHELKLEGGVPNEEATKRYLKLVKQRKLTPVFPQFADHPNFIKLKKDYARTDTPFEAVKPVFDLTAAQRVMDSFLAGNEPSAKVDVGIADRITAAIKAAEGTGRDIGIEALRNAEPADSPQDLWSTPQQEISSSGTSINETKLPASVKKIDWVAGTRNADIGGGRFDNVTEHLAGLGVENVIYDPFNRSEDHNAEAAARIRGGQADTVTVNNVLNVIQEPENRGKVVAQAADALKPGGTAYFLIHEGDGTGTPKKTSKGFQLHRKAKTYVAEVAAHFGSVTLKGTMLVATNPIKTLHQTDRGALQSPLDPDGGVTLYQDLDLHRGALQFRLPDGSGHREFNLALLEHENKSTIFHELGHFYLEMLGDLAALPQSDQSLKDDYATVLKWFGISDRSQITRDMHEQFADAHLQYLLEGNAPSLELVGAFRRFSNWLVKIGKHLLQAAVPMNDEIRGVFDRLYAADHEIEAAKGALGPELFTTAEQAGLSQAEFNLLKRYRSDAIDEAKEKLTSRLMRELERERKKEWREELAAAKERIGQEVDSRPEYKAKKALKEGVTESGLDISNLSMDEAAPFLGYDSADQLSAAIRKLEPRDRLVNRMAREYMVENHGDLLATGAIHQTAVDLLNGAKKEQLLAAELNVLRRLQKREAPFIKQGESQAKSAAAEAEQARAEQEAQSKQEDLSGRKLARDIPRVSQFKEMAKHYLGTMPVFKLKPIQFLNQQQSWARQAYLAALRNDYLGAAEAKEKELLNHHLYLESVKALQFADNFRSWVKRNDSSTVRGKIGKAGGTFLAQFDALRDRFGIERVPNKALPKSETLGEWAQTMESQYEDTVIDPMFLDESFQKNYRELSTFQLKALHEALKNIKHLAYRETTALINGQRIDRAQIISEIVGAMKANLKSRKVPRRSSSERQKALFKIQAQLADADASLVKIETLVNWIDGNDVNGPMHRYVFNRLAQAQTIMYDLESSMFKKLIGVLESMPEERRKSMSDSFDIPEFGPATRSEIITMALYYGQESRRAKLLNGYAKEGLTETSLKLAFTKLNADDAKLINEIWATFAELQPKILDLEERLSGVRPEWEKATPFDIEDQHGRVVAHLTGGYFPLVADPSLSGELGKKQEGGPVGQLFQNGYARASTSRGHTKELTKATYPLWLDFQHTLTSGLSNQIKDLAYREAVLDINRIFRNTEFTKAAKEHLGESYEGQLMPWLVNIVNDRNAGSSMGLSFWNNLASRARANTIAAVLGFKYSSGIVQIMDVSRLFTPGQNRVKARHFTNAFLQFLAHPVQVSNSIFELSGEMRHRAENLDRDMRQRFDELRGDLSMKARWNRNGFKFLSFMDALVSRPAWLAAYNQSLASGAEPDKAILEADRTVRLRLMSSNPKDLTAVQRGNELLKLATMFLGDATSNYNMLRDAGHNIDGLKGIPTFTAAAMVVMMAGALGELIKGQGPDDDEDWREWLARKAMLQPFQTVPIVRDMAGAVEGAVAGKPFKDYKFSPAVQLVQKMVDVVPHTIKFIKGEEDWKDYSIHAGEAIGWAMGIGGTVQAAASAKYLKRYSEGEEQPANAGELVYNTVQGKRKSR